MGKIVDRHGVAIRFVNYRQLLRQFVRKLFAKRESNFSLPRVRGQICTARTMSGNFARLTGPVYKADGINANLRSD